MAHINQTRICPRRDFVAQFIWNRSGKCFFITLYFAINGAIPPVLALYSIFKVRNLGLAHDKRIIRFNRMCRRQASAKRGRVGIGPVGHGGGKLVGPVL
jgi:hypothetical protein